MLPLLVHDDDGATLHAWRRYIKAAARDEYRVQGLRCEENATAPEGGSCARIRWNHYVARGLVKIWS
jgi:hypothetical protein